MKLKKAFTLAEAILTMTILGVIAAVMITTLKPSQYKGQGFLVLKQRIYTELDDVSQTILVECSDKMNFARIYTSGTATAAELAKCTKSFTPVSFEPNIAYKYLNYMRGAINSTACANQTFKEPKKDGTAGSTNKTYSNGIKLKNGGCIWFRKIESSESDYYIANDRIGAILIDVNGKEGPNALGSGNDREIIYIGNDGISNDMPNQ